jgi:hypothetical protein
MEDFMNISKRLATALFAATTSLLALAPAAMAGEGGAAAAVSFSTNYYGSVTGGAAAAAVGKNNAAAAATNSQSGYWYYNGPTNTATALGSAGYVYINTQPSGYVNISGSTDYNLSTPQANSLNAQTQAGTAGVYANVLP